MLGPGRRLPDGGPLGGRDLCPGGGVGLFSLKVSVLKSSSAVGSALADAMISGERSGLAVGSRKGLRETGRGGGSSKGDRGEGTVGDAARLRKGLLEERLRVRPRAGDRPDSPVKAGMQFVSYFCSGCCI